MSQAPSRSCTRESTSPGRRMNTSSSTNSFAVRSSSRVAAPGAVRGRVEPQVADPELGRALRRRPARDRAQPREQLAERERLDEVVVGSGVEARDPVLDRVPSPSASAPASRRPASAARGTSRSRRSPAASRRARSRRTARPAPSRAPPPRSGRGRPGGPPRPGRERAAFRASARPPRPGCARSHSRSRKMNAG